MTLSRLIFRFASMSHASFFAAHPWALFVKKWSRRTTMMNCEFSGPVHFAIEADLVIALANRRRSSRSPIDLPPRGRRSARSRQRAIAGPRQREKQDQIRAQNNVCAQDFMIIGRRRGRHGVKYSLHGGTRRLLGAVVWIGALASTVVDHRAACVCE